MLRRLRSASVIARCVRTVPTVLCALLAAMLAAMTLTACGEGPDAAEDRVGEGMQGDPGLSGLIERDFASDDGQIHAHVVEAPQPVPVDDMQQWVIRITDFDGEPVDGVQISVDGGMPAHGHGLPTAPRVGDALGDGRYRIEGLRFQMPGAWELYLDIASERTGAGRVTIQLDLE